MSDADEVPIEKVPTKKSKKISLAETEEKPAVEETVKPREYVMTPARKEALERMKIARQKKVLEIQQKKAEDLRVLEEAKSKKKAPAKKKKQVIVYESESSSEEENQIIIRRKRKPAKKTVAEETVPDDDDTPPPPPFIPRLRRL